MLPSSWKKTKQLRIPLNLIDYSLEMNEVGSSEMLIFID